MRDTFIIRTEWFDAIQEIDPIDQATIMRNLFYFHTGQEDKINLNNLSVKLVWKLIEPNLKRNLEAYDQRVLTSKENGKLGGRPTTKKVYDENLNKPKKPTVTLSDSDSVLVSDIVSESDSVPESVSESETEIVSDSLNNSEASSDFIEVETIETKKEKTPPKNSAKPPSTEYAKCMDVYNEWHKVQVGVPAKINALEGSKMKTIISYLETAAPNSTPSETLKYIFSKWKLVEPFYQNQTTLAQIDSNLTKLIGQIKNSRENKHQEFIASKKESIDLLKEYLNK